MLLFNFISVNLFTERNAYNLNSPWAGANKDRNQPFKERKLKDAKTKKQFFVFASLRQFIVCRIFFPLRLKLYLCRCLCCLLSTMQIYVILTWSRNFLTIQSTFITFSIPLDISLIFENLIIFPSIIKILNDSLYIKGATLGFCLFLLDLKRSNFCILT